MPAEYLDTDVHTWSIAGLYRHHAAISPVSCYFDVVSSAFAIKATTWLEIVAAPSGILSLLFVGLEIRQNTAMSPTPYFEGYWVERKWRIGFNKDFADLLNRLRLSAREGDDNG